MIGKMKEERLGCSCVGGGSEGYSVRGFRALYRDCDESRNDVE